MMGFIEIIFIMAVITIFKMMMIIIMIFKMVKTALTSERGE